MAKFKEKQKAITMRNQGMSYSQIKKILGVSKSTLSYWLKGYPLSEQRIRELRDWNEIRIEKYRETRRKKREKIFKQFYDSEKKIIFPFSKRDLFIAGLFLYWGEGGKTRNSEISLSNTDLSIIKVFIIWVESIFDFPKEKMIVRLHLYKDMNVKKECNWWSSALQIPLSQFRKPYIKNSSLKSVTHRKGGFGHGTCNILVRNAILAKRVLQGLKVISDYFEDR